MENKIKILVAEDDANLGSLLTNFLMAKDFEAKLAVNGNDAFEKYRAGEFDFLILDVMMPEKDGITLAKEIRSFDKNIPILFLTAKSMKEDKLQGFDAGADDYLTKPFVMEELLARINAILKRMPDNGSAKDKNKFEFGKFDFDYSRQMLKIDGEEIKLTTKENELLKLLCLNKNDVLDRNAALLAVWGDDNYFNGRSMDVYITKLRKHLKKDENIEIQNIHGKGFKLLEHA